MQAQTEEQDGMTALMPHEGGAAYRRRSQAKWSPASGSREQIRQILPAHRPSNRKMPTKLAES